jgi:hypothetical protein
LFNRRGLDEALLGKKLDRGWMLDDSWLGWFGEAQAHAEILTKNSQVTTFSNIVMDQAGLIGLFRRLHGLGIVLISIRQV